jgi:hypothetical protein
MSYTISTTSGSTPIVIQDTTIDNTSTDLTLLGKNISNYGQYINQNFVNLLENFANTSAPTQPITGQLWYDTSLNVLKVYNGTTFRASSGPIVQSSVPLTAVQGDLWIDSTNKQLWFFHNTGRTLAGPIYQEGQGESGFFVNTYTDTNGLGKTVVELKVAGSLLGIFSKETTAFSLKDPTAIPQFTGSIGPGFNQSTLSGLKFNVTATSASALVDASGNLQPAANFLSSQTNATALGQITIQNSAPLVLGPTQNTEILVSAVAYQHISNTSGQDYLLKVKNGSGVIDAITVRSINQQVGIFNNSPAYTLDVAGSFRASQSLMLPKYTSQARDARTLTAANYGEIIYNTTTNKAQVYNGTWNDLW